MFKKLLSITMLAGAALFANAQAPTPLPLDAKVKHGTLPNGLNYYILHNEEPKERANFYIAQKVGSTLENSDQLGLAHFLEHMAFNGTKNYPGKNMLNYLQSKGIRFGADINAYTSFDETVYNINNVPTTDHALMDSVLLVLHDWSCDLLLEEDEINAERGVIEEEWRGRSSSFQRLYEAALPVIYKEYQYQQMPIGKMEVVRNFAPQVLRDYYHKWYRPDQQGIIIVGDFDVEAMEKKVIDLFTPIQMPENAAPRIYPTVSDNEEPIFFAFKEKEMQFPLILTMFKTDPMPFEMRNSMEYFVSSNIAEEILAKMINNRLEEFSKKPECRYAEAGVSFGDFLVSKTKDAFTVQVIAKTDNVLNGAYEDAMGIVAQACKTGFTQSELVRARDLLLADYEKAYNERNNTNNGTLARKIIRHFIDNVPYLGAEKDNQMAQMLLQSIPLDVYNMAASEILTPTNQVVVVAQPETDNMTVVTKDGMITSLNNIINAEYTPYVDEVITDPLIANILPAGTVKSTADGAFGTKEITLSNGVKVIVKTTDFKQDEILMTAVRKGGKISYPESLGADVQLAENAFDLCKQGPFDHMKLQKYLAGKKINLGLTFGSKSTLLDGNTTVKDLPSLMELVYSSFTQLGPDAEAYNVEMDKMKSLLANVEKDQQQTFGRMIRSASYNNSPMFQTLSVELIESANYDQEMKIIKDALANPAEFTFIFTGNVNEETLKPLLEKYIASLPTKPVDNGTVEALSSINLAKGNVEDVKTLPMEVPSTMVYVNKHDSNLPYSIATSVKVGLVGEILGNIYADTLREEEGGTYSPSAFGMYNDWTDTWQLSYVFQTNDQMYEKLSKRAEEELSKLLMQGADEKNFTKVKEAALKQYDIRVRTNNYWSNNLFRYVMGIDGITGHREAIADLTLADFNEFMKQLAGSKNEIRVVLQGVEQK